MRVPSQPQSYFRYPLNHILASEGAVRVLRELMRHGGEMAIPVLAAATKLNQQTVRNVLLGPLSETGLVESVGHGRLRLYRVRANHPFHAALGQLFAEEEARVQRIFQALASAAPAAGRDVPAVWVFGSVARGEDAPGSDLDVAIVVPEQHAEAPLTAYRERLSPTLDREQISLSVVGLSRVDVLRHAAENTVWWRNVVADAQPVLGLPPAALAEHLRRTQTAGPEPAG